MRILKRFTNWIENGDLVPALIAVSVPHYATVLGHFDFAVVAAAIGFLVDVGHYRTIKLYMIGKGITWMLVLTALSVGFHVAFYSLAGAGLWSAVLGITPPAVIFALAFISRAEHLGARAARSVESSETRETRALPSETPIETVLDYATYLRLSAETPISAKVLIDTYHVPRATAYRWVKTRGV